MLGFTQSDKKILHGSVAMITVEDGEVAVVRNVGKRQTLGPGRYRLELPQQVLCRCSVKNQSWSSDHRRVHMSLALPRTTSGT